MRKSEAKRMCAGTFTGKFLIFTLALAAVVTMGACAAFQPPDANGPAANRPQYPIALSDVGTRLEEASVAWYQLSQRYGLPGRTEANLHPYTATLESLPANLPGPLYLPKVGSQTNPTEEDIRESLRRFIVEWQALIGADPNQLSLVERTDEPSGVKVARYEQRPFRYPLRGNFGSLLIRFRSDWQLVGFSSNCIPNTDRLQPALNALTPQITAEQAVNHVKTATVLNTAGQQQNVSLPANATVEARQLVVYAQPSKVPPSGLEIRLAWEIDVTNGPITKVYLDAISDEIIATS
ncbi:MAG TPA: hypothetical protein VK868_10895 [Pyrinomonadaceae bacterium]|nr:hypothetical protein [Pyrinomonadaceae bacterium]